MGEGRLDLRAACQSPVLNFFQVQSSVRLKLPIQAGKLVFAGEPSLIGMRYSKGFSFLEESSFREFGLKLYTEGDAVTQASGYIRKEQQSEPKLMAWPESILFPTDQLPDHISFAGSLMKTQARYWQYFGASQDGPDAGCKMRWSKIHSNPGWINKSQEHD